MPRTKPQLFSAGLHVALLAALLAWTTPPQQLGTGPSHVDFIFRPLRAPAPQRTAAGSNRTVLPARHGLPPPSARRTFIPPSWRTEPRLPMPVTVAFESPAIDVTPAQMGDAASALIIGGLGSNGFNGIGDHGCCGIGDGNSGQPGIDGGPVKGHRITAPQLVYKVEPEFSEAARKAKYQGVVVLAIEVGTDGRPRNVRVIEPLGLGLDEKAIEAVSQWRFRPGTRDGKVVVTSATVEVSFHLM